MVVPELARVVVIQRAAIALRRRVVVVHVGAGGRGAEPEVRHGVLRCCRQLVVLADHDRAAVVVAHHGAGDARDAAGHAGHATGKGARSIAPGELAAGAGGHIAVPDMLVLELPELIEVARRGVQAGVLVGAVPALVRQVGVRRGSGKLGMVMEQFELGIERVGRRRGRLAATQEHGVGQVGDGAADILDRNRRLEFMQALEGVLERRGLRTDHVLAGHRAGDGAGRCGAQAQAGNRQQHAGASAQHTQLHEIATIQS